MTERSPEKAARDWSTWTALWGLLLLCGLLMLLAALVTPQILGLVVVVFGFSAMILGHYLVWGWWLSRAMPPDEEDAGDR